MRRILWVCNIMLPAIARELNLPYSNREGWLSGIFERVLQKEAPFELGVCFPVESLPELSCVSGNGLSEDICGFDVDGRRAASGSCDVDGASAEQEGKCFWIRGVRCYAFLEDLGHPEWYDSRMESRFAEILEDFRPDVLHIFGTEFPHSLAAVRAFGRPERTLIGIQGLCSEIAKVYMAGLPEKVQRKVTFRDFVRKDSIRQQQEKFVLRGKNEIEAIRGCGNITGRTGFDREKTAAINPKANYYPMNETMRGEFYSGSWKLEKCERHSLFLGQGDYPLKGMHFVLQAMAQLLPDYPDLKFYVAGNSVVGRGTWKQRLKLPAYGKYLIGLMKKYGLEDKVIMTGKLDAKRMKERFLACHTFLCPSVLENSPNTVGEAMLLGVPVAASRAGGIPSLITHEKNGLLFQAGDGAALAEAIRRLWDEGKDGQGLTFAQRLSVQAASWAHAAHDGEKNYARLLEIYRELW